MPYSSSTQVLSPSGELDERNSDLDIDMFNIQGDKEAGHADRNSDLDIDSINLQSDSQAPLNVPVRNDRQLVADSSSVATKTFVIKTGGQIIGRLPEARLVEMARAGSLTREDAYQTDSGKWISVRTISSVYAEIARRDLATAGNASSPTEATAVSPKSVPAGSNTKTRGAAAPAKTVAAHRPKRTRRAVTRDPLLAEIFSEVFTEDGELNKERLANAGRPSAASTPTLPQAMSTQTTQSFSPPVTQPAFRPSPKSYPKRKSSGGGFEMPSPKVLGSVGGGVVALLLLIGSVNAFIGPNVSVNAEGFFKEVAGDFSKAQSGSSEEWVAFTEKFNKPAREIANALSAVASTNSKAQKQMQAALLVVRLDRQPDAKTETREELFAEFNRLLLQ